MVCSTQDESSQTLSLRAQTPDSNGKAEPAVNKPKKILRETAASKSDPYLVLLAHRNSHQEGFGTSAAQRLLSSGTKKTLPTYSYVLKPNVAKYIA